MGRAWRGRAAEGGLVALGSSRSSAGQTEASIDGKINLDKINLDKTLTSTELHYTTVARNITTICTLILTPNGLYI